MNKLDLQILSMIEISEAPISKSEKILFLEMIKECDIYQCMGFLMDHTIYNMNEEGKKEIKTRFITEQNPIIQLMKKIPYHHIIDKNTSVLAKGGKLSNKMSVAKKIKLLKQHRKNLYRIPSDELQNAVFKANKKQLAQAQKFALKNSHQSTKGLMPEYTNKAIKHLSGKLK